MPTSHSEARPPTSVSTQNFQRRGLFAAVWAAVIGLVLKYTTASVQAAASLQFGNVTSSVPVDNSAAGSTRIVDSGGYTAATAVFIAQANAGISMAGLHGAAGLITLSPPVRCGVYGETGQAAPTAGVMGDANHSSSGTGVLGQSLNGTGVMGQIPNSSNSNAIAVYGQNYSTYGGAGPGAGGFGVYGISAKGHGLVGATATSGGAAVVGASNGVAGAYAGAFYGSVVVSGGFTVAGGPKSAAVPHPDGSHRRLYCMESPESWFEDFGKGQLTCGRAAVTIDPDFAAVVDLSDYHVFLTEYGDHQGLHVTEMTPSGFTVQAKNGEADQRFSWRVVAKRNDITAERLAVVTIPPEPTLPSPHTA
ncbi:MAG TPA: hypothetical protein VH458_02680 [Vicinamibacterales bacterium]|jgi:hypothetical protein